MIMVAATVVAPSWCGVGGHFEQAELQLTREPRPLPKMVLNPEVKDLFAFTFDDFELQDYDPHPHIKAVVAV